MPASIRPVTDSDSAAVVRVIRDVYEEYGFPWDEAGAHSDLYHLDRHYFSNGHAFWVAEQAGDIVGTVALKVFSTLPGTSGSICRVGGATRVGGCDCSLERLYVASTARGTGAGGALVRTAILEAGRRERRNMEIWSDKRFREAHALYRRLGAVVVGERITYDPDPSHEWGMILDVKR